MKLITLALMLSLAAMAAGDSKAPEMVMEHRAAKPEPFLDRLASALGFGDKKSEKKGTGPPPPKGQPPQRRPRPPVVQQRPQPSYNAPVVAARPPQNSYGAPQAPVISRPQQPQPQPPRPPVVQQRPPQPPPAAAGGGYKPAASNNFPSVFGGGQSKPGLTRKLNICFFYTLTVKISSQTLF